MGIKYEVGYEDFHRWYCDENLSHAEIANRLGCHPCTIRNIRKGFGIKPRQRVRCKNMLGEKYGRWTVIEKCQHHQRVMWKCRCECGNEAEIERTHLIRYKSTQCRKCGYVSSAFVKPMPKYYWTKILHGAKDRNLEVSITPEYCRKLYDKQNGKCALTGVPLYCAKSVKEFKAGLNTASLDRIDSDKGYVVDNVQWTHKNINYMKMDFSQKEFVEWCRKVADYVSVG
jgi:hypothetical protein